MPGRCRKARTFQGGADRMLGLGMTVGVAGTRGGRQDWRGREAQQDQETATEGVTKRFWSRPVEDGACFGVGGQRCRQGPRTSEV